MPRPAATVPRTIRDRLADTLPFVGRHDELDEFRDALGATAPPFTVLFVYGPGGIGKSTLLRAFAELACTAGRQIAHLDAHHIEPTPTAVLRALSEYVPNAASDDDEALLSALSTHAGLVVLIDTFESFAPLDGWFRHRLLPRLAADALVVIAGRTPPSPAWFSDDAWRALMRVRSLRNFSPHDGDAFLARFGIAPERRRTLQQLTHGHPLALSLFADIVQQGGQDDWTPARSPHVVRLLLERFLHEVPSAQHRLALHACAVARTTTESLLRDAIPEADAHVLFEWLRGLSFVEQSAYGLHPHDLVRDLLDHDLRWRDPATNQLLHDRLRQAFIPVVRHGTGAVALRAMYDLTYLHRHNPVLGPYFAWQQFGSCMAEPVGADDAAQLFDYIARTVGADALPLARHWHAVQPRAWYMVTDAERRVLGVFMYLALHATTAAQRASDPRAVDAFAHAHDWADRQHLPLTAADEITLARFYVPPPRQGEPEPAMNAAQLAVGMRWMSAPRLAWSFCDVDPPEHWHGMLSYYDFHRVGSATSGLYGHDWRHTPVESWIAKIGAREQATELEVEALASDAMLPLLALSRDAFAAAVRDALRAYHTPERMVGNPLLQSRLLGAAASPVHLRRVLKEAVQALAERPRGRKFARALEATFLRPGSTQEAAAERLGLPFTTYRYQLARGLEQLVAELWQRDAEAPTV